MAATNIPAAKPSLAVKFPFVTEDGKEFSDLEKLLADLGQQSGGYYLLGANNCWHGGIHITDEKFAHHKNKHPVRCMMDGTVIAYRLNKNYPIQQWQAKSTLPATDLKFSNGFCLVRHEYENPVNPLTFYSLYMHLADYDTYVADSTNTEKTIAITKNTNARNTANISRIIGVLNRGSTLKIDTQQQPYQAAANGQQHDYYKGTIESKATGSDDSIAVGDSVYLYSGCFPAGTFTSTRPPVLPGYWKSKVIGKSKERMRVYRTEQSCKNRTTPYDALLNEQQTITFDAAQIKSATINGKTLKIALCKIDNAATFAHDARLNEGWMIVDESQISWKKVEPTEFDRIVKCNFPIKAGAPIGFMGIWESPAEPVGEGGVKTKYQMHVELFTTDDKAALDKFLDNDAKLTTGKKYLKVPKGSKLYSSDGHGGFINPHELLNAARDYVFEKSACTQVKDQAGTVFYNIKGIRTGEVATGPVDFAHVKIEDGVKLVTQNDWRELGFTLLEEDNDDADGYIDPEKIPSSMFKDIFKRVDGISSLNSQNGGILTGKEIKDALQQDKELRNDLYKIIAGHPSEWHSTTQNNMRILCEELKTKNTEEEYKRAIQFEIDRFLKCEFVSQIEGLTQKLWHFHPVIAVDYIRNNEKTSLVCKHCGSIINITADFMLKIAPQSKVKFRDDFSSHVNGIFNKYGISTCKQITHILSQSFVETLGFTSFKESLNYTKRSYTAKSLYNLSPTIINAGFEKKGLGFYTREQKLKYIDDNLLGNESNYAAHCYGNDEYPGRDYRGRGLLHLTHFLAYKQFHDDTNVDAVNTPSLLSSDIKIIIESGAWFWSKNNIGSICDAENDVKKVTKKINIGLDQLARRIEIKNVITNEFSNVYGGCAND